MEKEVKFEDSLKKLEDIVDQLEGGDLNLDKSLKLYEEGVKLTRSCTHRLEEAQKRIEVLMRSSSGKLETAEVDENLKPKRKKK